VPVTSALASLRACLYRLRARRSGGRLRIGRRLYAGVRLDVRGPGRVEIGDDVRLEPVPGDRLSFVTIYTHAPDAVVRIGHRASLYAARISCGFAVVVGSDVLMEDAAITDTDFHSIGPRRGEPEGESLQRCRVVIGNGVALGARSIVTKGVHIGDGSVIAPGAVVTRDLPSGCFALGNPARVVERINTSAAE
jgi:acetyltransferase-like isoleucine patch superfamily enzyme